VSSNLTAPTIFPWVFAGWGWLPEGFLNAGTVPIDGDTTAARERPSAAARSDPATGRSYWYAGHDSELVGLKSPVGRTSGTTSQRQLRSKHPWEGSRRQDYRHDGQEPNRRPRPAGQGSHRFRSPTLVRGWHGKFGVACREALSLRDSAINNSPFRNMRLNR
jgi:hypothetical protein